MKNNSRIHRTARRSLAFLLCLMTVFSVLTFADGAVFQTFAAAEAERVVVNQTYSFEFDQKTYSSLLKQLNAQLKKKKFSKLANSLFRDLLKLEVQNYPQWRTIYRDFPSTADYIKENLINVIPSIQKIKLINKDTEQGRIQGEYVNYTGVTTATKNGCIIRIFYRDPKRADEYEHQVQLATLAHEIRHVRDRAACYEKKHASGFAEQVLTEGAADFHKRHVFPVAAFQYQNEGFATKKNLQIFFGNELNCVYSYYQNFYDGLVYLAGYNTVNAIGKGKSDKALVQAITKRYGKETANSVWSLLNAMPKESGATSETLKVSNKAFGNSVKFFQLLLGCVKKDIQRLDVSKPKAIKKYMDVYRNVKLKTIPEIVNANNGKNLTEKYFPTAQLDSLLVDKIIASKAIPQLYDNKAWNRQAVLEILYCDRKDYPSSETFPCNLPPTIAQTTYLFTEEDGKPMVAEIFSDNMGWMVMFVCRFNENGTYSRSGDYLRSE